MKTLSKLLSMLASSFSPEKAHKLTQTSTKVDQRNTPKVAPEYPKASLVYADKPAQHPEASFLPPVPQAIIQHLKDREGVVYEVYRDSKGYLTAGVGHLLPKDTELTEGSPISPEQVEQWLIEDSTKSYMAAMDQCTVLGIADQQFCNALTSVNFQLGTGWHLVHKRTWHYLELKQYFMAAAEIFDSLWYQQTPTRVNDFHEALLKLGRKHKATQGAS